MLKKAVLALVQHTPEPMVRLAYRVPFVAKLASGVLRSASSSAQGSVVTIRQGPLAGKKLQTNPQTPNYYWLKGHDEYDVLEVLQQHINPGDTVVDIGAHIGIESMMMSLWVGESGKVISFEPDPINHASMRTNLQLNAMANVQTHAIALSDQQGQLHFIQGEGVLSRLVDDIDDPSLDPSALTTVEVRTLDEVFTDQALTIRLVKIDVEDYEGAVLRGAAQFLMRYRPVVLIELHSYASAQQCAQVLREAGYALSLIDASTDDFDAYLSTQPEADLAGGFKRCHLLATAEQ